MFRYLAALLTFAFATSCAFSPIKRPAIDVVKTVAVVSVFGNKAAVNADGDSSSPSTLQQLSSLNSGVQDRTAIFDHASEVVHRELAKVSGWVIKAPSEVVGNAAYKEFVANYDKPADKGAFSSMMVASRKLSIIAAKDMRPMYVSELTNSGPAGIERAKNLAKALGADAIAIAYVSVEYAPYMAIGGMGNASPQVRVSLDVVNRNGEVAVLYSGGRCVADNRVGMVAGAIILDAQTEAMYRAPVEQCVQKMVAKLNEELAKKP